MIGGILMKLTKRLLALLLTLALALCLSMPVFAEEEPNPAMPVITVQPQSIRVKAGQKFTLSVQAHIPNGEGVLVYHFNDDTRGYGYSNKTGELTIAEKFPGTQEYYVEVTNVVGPNNYTVKSETVRVEVYLSPLDWIGVGVGVFPSVLLFLACLMLPFDILWLSPLEWLVKEVPSLYPLFMPFAWMIEQWNR